MGMATARIPGNVRINSVLFPLPRHFVEVFGIYFAHLLGNDVAYQLPLAAQRCLKVEPLLVNSLDGDCADGLVGGLGWKPSLARFLPPRVHSFAYAAP